MALPPISDQTRTPAPIALELCASPQGPLVTVAPDQAHKPLDRSARVTLHHSAEWAQELRDLGLNARVTNTNIGWAARKLDNMTKQVEAYQRLVRIGAAQPQDAQGLGEIFALKAKSLTERFELEFREVRGSFETGQALLQRDLI